VILKQLVTLTLVLSGLCVFVTLNSPVKAQHFGLSMTVNCPTEAYADESFFCQVTIYNNDSVSHQYELLWFVDTLSLPKFETSGTIGPNETVNTGSSFTFSESQVQTISYLMGYNAHLISITLTEDGQQVKTEDNYIRLVKVEMSLVPTVTPIPVYPGSSFELSIKVVNDGDEQINATVVMYELDKIQLQSAVTARLDLISPGSTKSQTFKFEVAFDIVPGTYPLKVAAEFVDTRGRQYSRKYYVPIQVFSRKVVDEVSLLQSEEENDINRLSSDLATAIRNSTMISVVVLVVSISLALGNYWYTRSTTHAKRRTVRPRVTERPR